MQLFIALLLIPTERALAEPVWAAVRGLTCEASCFLGGSHAPKRLVLDLSCRRREADGPFYVVTDRWQKFTNLALSAATLKELSAHCDEFLVHAVDVEGKQSGVEADLVSALGEWSPIPVTYAGGARSLADLEVVSRLGKGKVDLAIGSALDVFGGALPYEKVVSWCRARGM